MSYHKRFFLAIVMCYSLGITLISYVIRNKISPTLHVGTLFVSLLGLAGMSRISNGLAERFTRFIGRLILTPTGQVVTNALLRRNIQLAPIRVTTKGSNEISYEYFDYNRTLSQLELHGIKPDKFLIDLQHFYAYLQAARYDTYHPNYYRNADKYRVHKQIQHYLSTVLTPVSGKGVWMDVASSTSPFPEIVTRLYGIDAYRQDISYPNGIRGLYIGSNAAKIPVADGSIDHISLHCSFEHFENGSDTAFIYELARILRRGGKAAIIPLYLSNTYQILTNPRYWLIRGTPREADAQITVSRTYWESHGRFYDAKALDNRILQPLKSTGLNYRFIQVEVPPEIDYPTFIVLVIEKS